MSLLALDQIVKSNPLIERQVQVGAIHHDKWGRLLVLVKGCFCKSIDADEEADGVLALTPNLCGEDVCIAPVDGLLPPTRLNYVVISVVAERAVNLLPLKAVRKPRLHVEETKNAVRSGSNSLPLF